MVFYASWKLLTMFTKTDYKVQVYDLESFYDYEAYFGVDDGFIVAAALTAYDRN